MFFNRTFSINFLFNKKYLINLFYNRKYCINFECPNCSEDYIIDYNQFYSSDYSSFYSWDYSLFFLLYTPVNSLDYNSDYSADCSSFYNSFYSPIYSPNCSPHYSPDCSPDYSSFYIPNLNKNNWLFKEFKHKICTYFLSQICTGSFLSHIKIPYRMILSLFIRSFDREVNRLRKEY